jgi:hypothetical protein
LSNLAIIGSTLPATPEHVQKMLVDVRDAIIASGEEVEIPVEHFLWAGMYSRTIRVPAGKTIWGALIKIPTTVIVHGHTRVLVGEEVEVMTGYNVIQAGPGRMQVFVAVSDIEITMMFATSAQTVEEAEREFTDEYEQLQSRRSTGE